MYRSWYTFLKVDVYVPVHPLQTQTRLRMLSAFHKLHLWWPLNEVKLVELLLHLLRTGSQLVLL